MSSAIVLELHKPEDKNESCSCPQVIENANVTTVRRCAYYTLSYNDFFWKYMYVNCPLVLAGVSNTWECRRNWTQNPIATSDNMQPCAVNTPNTAINYDYLKHKLGNCQVPVANCSKEYFNSHEKCEMSFHDYLDYWQQKNKLEIKKNQDKANINDEPNANKTEKFYLKDWHLKANMPDYDFYTVPKHFASDWLNEYLIDNGKDDYRFVYMGPKDSWTPFHADVFGSYSWSTNIVGCKRWLLLPPGEENRLKDKLGNVPFRISEQLLLEKQVKHFKIDQLDNESIFVPSGWYHQVHNVTDTISINHNWFNACNLQKIWHNLSLNMQQVVAEIEDCRQMDNFEEHCHTMLRASFGLNFDEFLNMLEHIAAKRSRYHNNNNQDTEPSAANSSNLIFNKYALNEYHAHYDLNSIYQVIEKMLQNDAIVNSRDFLYRRCLCLREITKSF